MSKPFTSYAQNFEDVRLRRAFSDVPQGRYLDIGTQDPVMDSVSLAFYELGWRGIHVEPTPTYASKMRSARPDETVVEAAVSTLPGPIQFFEIPGTGISTGMPDIAERHAHAGWESRTISVPTVTLAKLFDMMGDAPIQWLKIDVEGMEADVIKSWGDHPARPAALVIEATAPNTQIATHDAWYEMVLCRGYRDVLFDGLSRYFVHEAHAERGDALALSPNIFDGFQVTFSHFSAGQLSAQKDAAMQRAEVERETASGELRRDLEAALVVGERAQASGRAFQYAGQEEVHMLSPDGGGLDDELAPKAQPCGDDVYQPNWTGFPLAPNESTAELVNGDKDMQMPPGSFLSWYGPVSDKPIASNSLKSSLMNDPIDIIVPVYKNLEMTRDCLNSLKCNIGEISDWDPRIVVINDSPDDRPVTAFLNESVNDGTIDFLISNKKNQGFVRSVNLGIGAAQRRGASAILVNSDTVTFPGTLREMVDVSSLDEQIGFVCPRSNNASICTFPVVPHARAGTAVEPDECYAAWRTVSHYLPRYNFAPTAIGFYMLIKRAVLDDFEKLDEVFDIGYEEENDLVLRANKVGFRAVLANHAYAFHAGSASFLLQDMDLDSHREANLQIMNGRHPEFIPLIRQYEQSPEFRAERLLRNLVPNHDGRFKVIINLLAMSPSFNGTNELILNVIKKLNEITSSRFDFILVVRKAVSDFHNMEQFKHLRRTEDTRTTGAVAIDFGQPYSLHTTNLMECFAPINVFAMLDVISWDCGYLRVSQNIDGLWKHVAQTANGLAFISKFSESTFKRSFKTPAGQGSYARLLPTKVSAYNERYQDVKLSQSHVFIAGNHFCHKDSLRTAEQLSSAFPSVHFTVFADQSIDNHNVSKLKSGMLSDEDVIAVMASSSAMVLPSYYEGFGFSIMHALALGKPVVARDIPATREILATFGNCEGIFLFKRNSDLPAALTAALKCGHSRVDDSTAHDWADWANGLAEFLDALIERPDVYDTLVDRISSGDVMRALNAYSHASAPQQINEGSQPVKAVDYNDNQKNVKPAVYNFIEIEKLSKESFIQFIYQNVLGREADSDGHNHHLQLLNDGASREEILRAFFNSSEYKSSHRSIRIEGMGGGWSSRMRSRFFNKTLL